jgi:hypothetical protein
LQRSNVKTILASFQSNTMSDHHHGNVEVQNHHVNTALTSQHGNRKVDNLNSNGESLDSTASQSR